MLTINVTTRVARRIIPVLAALWLLVSCAPAEPPSLTGGTLLPAARMLAPFTLIDHHNQPFTSEALLGQWSFVFFGYIHCPDVCPIALGMLKRMQTLLEAAGDTPLPQVLFISVDPERDTPEILSRYVTYFHPTFVGVTGKNEELMRLTRQLGILYGKSSLDDDKNNYLVDHSGAIILLNPQGDYQALFSMPHDADKIAADFVKIRNWYKASR